MMNSDYIGGTIAIPMVRVCYPYGHLSVISRLCIGYPVLILC